MRKIVVASLTAVMPLIVAADRPATEPLPPTSTWVVDYADQSCRLIRQFASGEDMIKLVIEKVAPRASASVLVVGPGVPRKSSRPHENDGIFQPFVKSVIENGASYKAENNGGEAIIWQGALGSDSWLLDPDDPALKKAVAAVEKHRRPPPRTIEEQRASLEALYARAKNIVSFDFTSGPHRTSLSTGPMEKPMRILDQCARDGLADWGIDPNTDALIVRPAMSVRPAVRWFTTDDYPVQALRRSQESDMALRVNVDAAGKVTDCHVVSSVDAAEINKAVCGIMRERARFLPAELADGTKVADYDVVVLKFRLPD